MKFQTRTLFATALTAGAIACSGAAMAAQPPGLNATNSDVPLYNATGSHSQRPDRLTPARPAGLNATNSDVPVYNGTGDHSQRLDSIVATRPAGLNTTNSDVPLYTASADHGRYSNDISVARSSHRRPSENSGVNPPKTGANHASRVSADSQFIQGNASSDPS